MKKSISKQSGNAGIMFVILFPVMFGIFVLALDGARALQSKARLDDALEAAAIAVSAADSNSINIPQAYITFYLPDAAAAVVPPITPSAGVDTDNIPFLEYSITATTTHNSWFPGNDAIQGFGDTFSVAGSSSARKYFDAVDVVFAADFSGSMYRWMPGSYKPKYKEVLDIIGEVTDVLEQFNQETGEENTAAFTAFNIYTNEYIHHPFYFFSPDWPPLPARTWCYVDHKSYNLLGTSVDYDDTASVENIFPTYRKGCELTLSEGYILLPNFHDVEPTSDFTTFTDTIEDFSPTRDSASYQGIIRAAQLAIKGKNTRRLIIVLSDGKDSHNGLIDDIDMPLGDNANHAHYTEELVKAGMCDNIRKTLNIQKVEGGGSVTSRIVVIGFDYNTDINPGLRDCAKENNQDNIYEAKDREDIKNKILSLISEEIGHLS